MRVRCSCSNWGLERFFSEVARSVAFSIYNEPAEAGPLSDTECSRNGLTRKITWRHKDVLKLQTAINFENPCQRQIAHRTRPELAALPTEEWVAGNRSTAVGPVAALWHAQCRPFAMAHGERTAGHQQLVHYWQGMRWSHRSMSRAGRPVLFRGTVDRASFSVSWLVPRKWFASGLASAMHFVAAF